jgi:uncharacterized circularly permuted ATP-grasp superfamily protein/uncharacterized alpha-E superfamily protein
MTVLPGKLAAGNACRQRSLVGNRVQGADQHPVVDTPTTTQVTDDSIGPRCFRLAPAGVYDEVHAPDGRLRPHWQGIAAALAETTAAEFDRRTAQAERLLRDNGLLFHGFADEQQARRPWRLDLMPLVLAAQEWRRVEAGITQRARLLERIVLDCYGPQRLLNDGVLPPQAIFAHPGFLRPLHNLHRTDRRSLVLYAAELARGPDGNWWVMADRSEAPPGAGFALENRIIVSRSIPDLMHRANVQRLATFFLHLQEALHALVPRATEHPRIVVLTAGPTNDSYFEDIYLASYLGYTVVQSTDLAVRDDRLYLKTLAGLLPVDVVLCRGDEVGLDPLELGGAAPHGVPGLLQAVRQHRVALANAPGCGLIDSPAFMAFLPGLCRRLLGEELALPSIPTWWCGDESSRRYVLDHLSELVIKPAFSRSGGQEYLADRLSSSQLAELRGRIAARPWDFVAQEKIARSATPVWEDGRFRCGHVALRVFACAHEGGYSLMPGGLIRVARTPDPMRLSIAAGDGSKDLWVLGDAPVEPVTLLKSDEHAISLRRTSAFFPSRVADDLFWLGQSLERADFLAHLLRSVIERLTAESEHDWPELPVLVRALAEQGQVEPGFALAGLDEQLPDLADVLPKLVSNVQEPRGVVRAVSEMARLASQVRDWLSPDTWRKLLQGADGFMLSASEPWPQLADLLASINQLLSDLAAATGVIQEGMIRGPAWRFLDMGRRLERGRDVGALIVSYIGSRRMHEKPVLQSLIEVLDCRMTYRARYLDDVQRNAVLDLGVTDETNPRSVAYQINALADHVDALPHDEHSPLRTEEKRLVMAAAHRVRMLTPEQLAAPDSADVVGTLKAVDQQLKVVTETLTRKYLVHSGAPRHITLGVERQR